MNIYEATLQALEEHKSMARTADDWKSAGLAVIPTNSSMCCLLCAKGKAPRRGWEPTAEDLTATDWAVTERMAETE